MTTEQSALWQKVSTFLLDAPGVSNPYSARLAKDSRWTRVFAMRVIEEYRRFAFLSAVADHPVSPSEAVDQAWHLHLFYTMNYWNEFCKETLGKPLHHTPSQGDRARDATFEDWYQLTLESYERLFGEAPPADIWPSSATKQTLRHDFVRVDRTRHWVIPKVSWQKALPYFGTILGGVALFGCAKEVTSANPFDLKGVDFLPFYLGLWIVCMAAAFAFRRARLPVGVRQVAQRRLTPTELACLAGGAQRCLITALAGLSAAKLITITAVPKRITASGLLPDGVDDYTREVFNQCSIPTGRTVDGLQSAMMSQYAAVQDELIEHGMIMLPQQRRRLQWMTLGIASIPLLFAFTRFMNAMIYNHSAGYLVGLVLLTAGLSFFVLANFPMCTKAGEKLVGDARSKQTTSAWKMTQTEAILPAPMWAIAVFGIAAVDPADRVMLASMMYNPNQSSGGGFGRSGCTSGGSFGCSSGSSGCSGGGSSCGGGGGGGGCGGCGSG